MYHIPFIRIARLRSVAHSVVRGAMQLMGSRDPVGLPRLITVPAAAAAATTTTTTRQCFYINILSTRTHGTIF